MKTLFFSLAAALAFSAMAVAPSNALTLQQAMDEVAGMSCAGSTCSASVETATDVDLPDIVTTDTVLVRDAKRGSGPSGFSNNCLPRNAMNGKPARVCQDVTRDGVPESISSTSGSAAVYRDVTTVTDGGTETVYSCSTTTKEMSYNGPNTDRANAWSVSSSTSSSGGRC